ncbi:hypothetical protein QW131_16345 [Roseibium salinum]|nr:hypothetical protein [Roseibium salinum]
MRIFHRCGAGAEVRRHEWAFFSKSSRPGADQDQRVETESEAGSQTGADETVEADETIDTSSTSNVEHLSPFALRMQEKLNQLDGLKSRIGGLNQTFDQMAAFAAESQTSIRMIADYLEGSRTSVETEVRLKSENAKISTDLLDAQHRIRTLTNQLEDAQAEVHSLRKRSTETRTALESARNDIVSIRDNNKKVNEEYRLQSAKLVEVNSRASELGGQLNDLKAKFDTLEKHAENLGADLEAVRHREKGTAAEPFRKRQAAGGRGPQEQSGDQRAGSWPARARRVPQREYRPEIPPGCRQPGTGLCQVPAGRRAAQA